MKKLLSTILLTLATLMPTALWAQGLAGDSTVVAEPYAVLSEDSLTVTFYYDNQKSVRGGIEINNSYIAEGKKSPYGTAKTAVFDASFADYMPTSTAFWFANCSSLTSIVGIENLKTDEVTNMSGMFWACWGLTSLDLSSFNTQNVTNMSFMFEVCNKLQSLNLSSFNTQNVTDMSCMFDSCSGLTSLDLSNFNTENVTTTTSMFVSCEGMTTLNISSFNTQNVTNMSQMFDYCKELTTIYVGEGWSTAKVQYGETVFNGCVNLVGGAGTVYDADHVDYSYAHIDGGASNPGYFTRSGDEPYQPVEGVWVEQLENGDAEKPWVNPDTRWNDEVNNYKICAWGKTKGRNLTEDGNGWNAFPADIEEEEGGNGNHVFVVHATLADTDGEAAAWDNQFWIQSPQGWSAGTRHRIRFRYKASQNVDVVTQVHNQNPSDYLHYTAIGNISFTTDWQLFDGIMIVDNDMAGCWSICFNLNSSEKNPTDFYFDDLSWSAYTGNDIPQDAVIVNLVNNGDMEGDDNSNYFVRLGMAKGNEIPTNASITDGVGVDNSRGIKVEVGAMEYASWDNQFWVRLNKPVSSGTRYRLSFDYRADKEALIGNEAHEEPGVYINYYLFSGDDLSFTQDWKHYEYEGVMSSNFSSDQLPFQSMTFSLSTFEEPNTYYFDNFEFEVLMGEQCPRPTIKEKGNVITIESPFDAVIYYTLDGSTPSVNSEVYSGPIKLTQDAEINAITVADGYETSLVATHVFIHPTFDSNGVLTAYGSSTFADVLETVGGREEVAKTLTAINWNSACGLNGSDLQGLENPNLLIYVQKAVAAAIEYRDNVIIDGVAKNIVLKDVESGNGNFYCPQAFTAEKVTYTRNFQQHTQVGVSQGWESIALPFNVQTITHEKQGVIAPFGNTASEKHFWLRRLGDSGLIQATKIEANVPYIISMPNNNEVYNADYNLPGKVMFTAQDVVVPVTAPVTLAMADNSVLMVPAFQSVGRSSDVWALNVGEVRGQYLEGSAFERDYREIRPFEAYTVHRSNTPAPRFVPIKDMTNGDVTGIEDVRGMMSDDRGEGAWYDLNGRKIVNGKSVNGKLPRGVYIQNGKKVVIK